MHTLQNQVKSKVRIKAQRQKLNCHFNADGSLPLWPVGVNADGPLLLWPVVWPIDPSARHVLVRPLVHIVILFKSLDKQWMDEDDVYNFHSELTEPK